MSLATWLAAAAGLAVAVSAGAQEHPPHHHAPEHPAHQPAPAHDHAAMEHRQGEAATPREPVPELTDADRAAAFPDVRAHAMHGKSPHQLLELDRLEARDADHGTVLAWKGRYWFGGDVTRLWLRSHGERMDGRTESGDVEALYGRSFSPWWDFVTGVRHDFGRGPSRTYGAIGVQGLAPWFFEIEATAYFGESGRTAARIEAEYELLLTNRLILQPLIEAELYGDDDPGRGIGSGVATLGTGLRLRYEITRRFAPYLGVTYERAFSDTADLRRALGEDEEDVEIVAGVRAWF